MTDDSYLNISEIKLSNTSLFSVQIMSYLGGSVILYSSVIDSFISDILKLSKHAAIGNIHCLGVHPWCIKFLLLTLLTNLYVNHCILHHAAGGVSFGLVKFYWQSGNLKSSAVD